MTIDFASETESQRILGTRDAFVAAHSPLDRQVRLNIFDREPSEADVLTHLAQQGLSWSDAEKAHIRELFGRIDSRFRELDLRLPLPPQIWLVKTTGDEEFGAAYTRQTAIILPAPLLAQMNAQQLEGLLVHELFHVMTRTQPQIRQQLYAIIGFKLCDDVLPVLPASFHQRRLTNPDMPHYDAYTFLVHQGHTHAFMMTLGVGPSYQGGAPFDAMQVRLLKVADQQGKMVPVLKEGQPETYPVSDFPQLTQQLGRDTDYHIQPEESLAAYFERLYQPIKRLQDPQIVERMKHVLRN